MAMKLKDLTGSKFGRLTVIERQGSNKHGRPLWLCECECKKRIIKSSQALISSHTQSCGCLRMEVLNKSHTKHGLKGTRLYEIWKSMKKRCCNPKQTNYKNYGGRGITVCDEWKKDFQAFYDWAMAHGYDANASRGECTIDRIDANGNYCPGNCRWITIAEQQRNKRNNKCKRGETIEYV